MPWVHTHIMRRLGLERDICIPGGGFILRHAADGIDELVRKRLPIAEFAVNALVALGATERLSELGRSSLATSSSSATTTLRSLRIDEWGSRSSTSHASRSGSCRHRCCRNASPTQQRSRHLLAPKLGERESTATWEPRHDHPTRRRSLQLGC